MSRSIIASSAAAISLLMLAACQTEPVQPSPETASTTAPASSPATPIRGIAFAPQLAGQSHWAVHHCTSDGAAKACD